MIIANDESKSSVPFVNGGVFRMTTVKWPDWYVKMNDDEKGDLQGKQGYPGQQGEFKFTRIGYHYYFISPRRWPDWYVYMEEKNGNVRGCKGRPGSEGHWRVVPRSDGTVLLSTERWRGCYMCMKNKPSGDVQGTEEPDEQAYFILSCDVQLTCGHDQCFLKAQMKEQTRYVLSELKEQLEKLKEDVPAYIHSKVEEVFEELKQGIVVLHQSELKEHLEELKQEVKKVVPLITDGIKHTILSQEDVLLMRYSQLDHMDRMTEDIKAMFQNVDDVRILDFIISTATSMIGAVKHSMEMKEVMRWHQRKVEKRINDKVIGMEAHYKVEIKEYRYTSKTKYRWMVPEKETVVLIAYKVMAHTLDRAPGDFLSAKDISCLIF